MFRPVVDAVAHSFSGGRTRLVSGAVAAMALFPGGLVAEPAASHGQEPIGHTAVSAAQGPNPSARAADVHSVVLSKSVYLGHDGGARCHSALTFTEARANDPVTYCFIVTNTGTSPLSDIVVSDPLIGETPILAAVESSPLQPGHTARYYLQATPPPDEADGFLDDTYINYALVSARPVDGAGAPIEGAASVDATAEAVVFPPDVDSELVPRVGLVASVYGGTDDGAGCPAAKAAVSVAGAPITYCYTITNTGNTHIGSIELVDALVSGSPTLLQADSLPLAPGDSAYYHLDTTAPVQVGEGFLNTSVVTANPVDSLGADLVGLGDVTANDSVTVDSLAAAKPEGPTDPQRLARITLPAEPGYEPGLIADPEAPTELAYTGWESWLIGALGVALVGGGLYVLDSIGSVSLRTALQPVPHPDSGQPASGRSATTGPRSRRTGPRS